MDVKVTDKQVEAQLKKLKSQYFGGSESKYKAELKRQCVTDAEVRDDLRANLLSNAIFTKVTANAKVAPAEVRSYYDTHREVYTSPQTRVVSHILVKNKALADKLYKQLQNGASFAALAKKYSIDPGSKAQGGQLTITRGQTVAPFDRVAFELRTGQLSKPVHTQYGWHIIHADKPATPHKSTPFAQVKASIQQQLLQQKRNTALQSWLTTLKKEYDGKISYAAGLAPAATTTAPTTTG
jgi:parvulin-like peptidyl-prolyl isomerase